MQELTRFCPPTKSGSPLWTPCHAQSPSHGQRKTRSPVTTYGKVARERLPQATFQILPDVNHVPTLDDPDLAPAADDVRAFRSTRRGVTRDTSEHPLARDRRRAMQHPTTGVADRRRVPPPSRRHRKGNNVAELNGICLARYSLQQYRKPGPVELIKKGGATAHRHTISAATGPQVPCPSAMSDQRLWRAADSLSADKRH